MKKKRRLAGGRYTFLVLPDDGGPSVRFRASALLLAVIPILTIALAGAASTFYLLHERSAWKVDRLQEQIAMSSGSYRSEIAFKDASILNLRKQVVEFAGQAADVQSRLDELDKLASAMQSFVGLKDSSPREKTAEDGTGGELFTATDSDYRDLADGMDDLYASLDAEIDELKATLTRAHTEVVKKKQLLRSVPSLWPTHSQRITSQFGVRIDPFTGNPAKHTGLDIAGHFGDSVYAAADGTVSETGFTSTLGNYVLIRHKGSLSTKYMHMSRISVRKGDVLKQGGVIGAMGSTGRSTGPHLHFEVLEHGVPVDPKPYLNIAMKELPTDVQVLEERQD
ncbi:M23 family metallopeptidase [Paenibacillus sacheonensis]|uniref:Peptidoglycan DD-metalloendopeptidase family protein n=1 Tax=Paenibacillus sacheonensis TaxID=742054 RepID=A0A7X4YUR2_9BACL|nr:M23 family metallopeptidase [Paenibacillus sacheonensis]MBM7568033.1 murein DD-endopeptidase MepM/ murein hydrolase activator NlpD [Paenibacillus sacheonensis]NBC72937.1 peptidoglycan DD-metalloendopeptidase family protein [Paenibacillus sacheonensis]